MKIRLILLMLIINVSIALAQIDINILRQDYSPFETLQVEITLNNPTRELLANDVKIDNIKIAPFIVPLEKNKYFVYFDILDIENNTYNLTVNSRFLINNALTDVTERKEFNVINSNYSLSVKPAILIIDKNNLKESYKIILKNNNYPLDVNIKLDSDFLYPARNTISLLDNEEKNLFIFSKQGAVEEAKIILNYDRIYEIPVIIKSSQIINEENNSIEEAEQKASFITEQPFLTRELAPDEAVSGPLEFRNNLNRNLRIKFYLTDDLNKIIRINTTNIILKPNEIASQYIWINEKKNSKGYYEGDLVLEAEDYKEDFPVKLTFTESIEEEIPEEIIDEEDEESQEGLEEIGSQDLTPETEIGIINFSSLQSVEEQQKQTYIFFPILLITVIVLLLLIIFYLSRVKKPPKTFNEYVYSVKR